MAMIYQPLEIQKDGKGIGLFHMTAGSDESGGISAVGPCAENCPGHATKELAYEHWGEGKLADATYDLFHPNQQNRCCICKDWTQKEGCILGTFYEHYPLCDQHLNLEGLKQARKAAREARKLKSR